MDQRRVQRVKAASEPPVRTGFRLEQAETIGDGVRRIAFEEVDEALDQLSDLDGDRQERIHEARKRLKRLRGLLRLVRSELGATYAAENTVVRDSGRRLSGARDADAVVETFDALREHYRHRFDAKAARKLRREILDRRSASLKKDNEFAKELSAVVTELEKLKQRIRAWPLEADEFGALAPNLEKTYCRGREALEVACHDDASEKMHELRKRVKYHAFHVRLLEPLWPDPMRAYRKSLRQLGRVLGDLHDLDLLVAWVGNGSGRRPSSSQKLLLDLAHQRRGELVREARSQGRRVFAEPPKAFRKRIGAYWEAWRQSPSC